MIGRPYRDRFKFPSPRTLRISVCGCVPTNNRSACSTTAFLVAAPVQAIASRSRLSSISMFIRTVKCSLVSSRLGPGSTLSRKPPEEAVALPLRSLRIVCHLHRQPLHNVFELPGRR